MSFTERITGILQRPNDATNTSQVEAPWFLKYGSRLLGIVGAFFAILFGLWNCFSIITFSVTCLVSGILQICAGFTVMSLEAPMCFFCIEHVDKLAKYMDNRPLWHRAGLYCVISLPPVILCFGLASFFGCGLLFATGLLYGMMALGKKATADEMRQAAVNSGFSGNSTTNDRAGIINNAQPFSFTGAVSTDSNV